MKLKKNKIIAVLIFILINCCTIVFARYIINHAMTIIINTANYKFDVIANETSLNKTLKNVEITVQNFVGDDVSDVDIEYDIQVDNDKFNVSIDKGSFNRTLNSQNSTKQTDAYILTIEPKSVDNLLEKETINLIFNVKSPYTETKKITLEYLNEELKLQFNFAKEPIRISKGNTNYLSKIENNAIVTDQYGNQLNANITYKISENFDVNNVGYYSVTYNASYEDCKDISNDVTTIVCEPRPIEFEEAFDYETVRTNLNSQENGIISLTSTDYDPQIVIPFSDLAYYSPLEYRYVIIGYKCNSQENNLMGVFATPTPTNNDYFVYANPIKTDGVWRECVLDLWSNENIKNLEWVSGIRFDYTNNPNITMEVDYIKFLNEPTTLEFGYYEDFLTDSYTNFTYTNLNVLSCQDGILSLQSTTGDSQIRMALNEEQYIDPKKYKYLHVRYKINVASSQMEIFMVPDPLDQTYSVSQTITGNNQWQTAVFDLTTNSNVINLEKITGWRLDPVTNSGVNIQIDYIGLSDKGG